MPMLAGSLAESALLLHHCQNFLLLLLCCSFTFFSHFLALWFWPFGQFLENRNTFCAWNSLNFWKLFFPRGTLLQSQLALLWLVEQSKPTLSLAWQASLCRLLWCVALLLLPKTNFLLLMSRSFTFMTNFWPIFWKSQHLCAWNSVNLFLGPSHVSDVF